MNYTTINLLIRDINRVNKVPVKTLTVLPTTTIVNIFNNLFGLNGSYNLSTITYNAIEKEIHHKNGLSYSALSHIPTRTMVDMFKNLFGLRENELTPLELSRVHFPFVKQSSNASKPYSLSEDLTIDDLLDLLFLVKDIDNEFADIIKKRLAELSPKRTA